MRWLALVLASLLVVAGTSGCFVVDARQTLRHLEDGRTLVAEGRREICLRIVDDASGDLVEEDCDLDEDPLDLGEYAVFPTSRGSMLVGVAPVDAAQITVTTSGGQELDVELVESDLTTGFYLADLPGDLEGGVTVTGATAEGDRIGEPLEIPGH